MLNTLDRQKIDFQLNGITIDALEKNLIFRLKTKVPLSCSIINLITTFCWHATLVCHFFGVCVGELPFDMFDICKDKWFHKLGASINLQTMILPSVK